MAAWEDFLREARRFWEVAQLADTPGFHSQAVSNAVHAAIAANDALCLHRLGERARGQSHSEAASALKRACQGSSLEAQAAQRAQQLADVLAAKAPSQYYREQMDAETARRVMKQAERFLHWVEETLTPA